MRTVHLLILAAKQPSSHQLNKWLLLAAKHPNSHRPNWWLLLLAAKHPNSHKPNWWLCASCTAGWLLLAGKRDRRKAPVRCSSLDPKWRSLAGIALPPFLAPTPSHPTLSAAELVSGLPGLTHLKLGPASAEQISQVGPARVGSAHPRGPCPCAVLCCPVQMRMCRRWCTRPSCTRAWPALLVVQLLRKGKKGKDYASSDCCRL